jgi:hypothetical protein
MAQTQDAQAMQPPRPDPALKRLERFVGTWEIKGRTLDAEEDNVFGRTMRRPPGRIREQTKQERAISSRSSKARRSP